MSEQNFGEMQPAEDKLDVGEATARIGNVPTTTDVDDPERASRNTAAGTGSGDSSVETASDEGTNTDASIQPHNQGQV